jgi:hypothetical protein
MAMKIFQINKGINRPVEFRGLKGQYIGYFAACVVGTLGAFGVLYACGISLYICTPLALGLGGVGFSQGLPDEQAVWSVRIDEAKRETADAGRAALEVEKGVYSFKSGLCTDNWMSGCRYWRWRMIG